MVTTTNMTMIMIRMIVVLAAAVIAPKAVHASVFPVLNHTLDRRKKLRQGLQGGLREVLRKSLQIIDEQCYQAIF